MQTGKGFKKSLLVILHLESNLRVLCVLDFRNSPLISLNLPNYANYFNYLARLITIINVWLTTFDVGIVKLAIVQSKLAIVRFRINLIRFKKLPSTGFAAFA